MVEGAGLLEGCGTYPYRLALLAASPACGGGKAGRRPHQRDRLRKIADIVVGKLEQHGVGAFGDEAADQSGLGVRKGERAGQCRQRPAALGIGRRAKIIRHQTELGVARRLVGEAVEQFGEAVHSSASPFSSFRGARSANPESITPARSGPAPPAAALDASVVTDSGLRPSAVPGMTASSSSP